jgi:four helix bundle protein
LEIWKCGRKAAKGSAAELRTQVYIARQIGIVDQNIQKELIEELKVLSSMLHALIKSLKK